MAQKYFSLSRIPPSSLIKESEESESAPMIHDCEKIRNEHRSKRNQVNDILHWIGHAVSVLTILILVISDFDGRCSGLVTEKTTAQVWSKFTVPMDAQDGWKVADIQM
jgi:hypothetical protein